MAELNKYDMQWCVRRLPHGIRKMLKKNEVVVAGGYVRACIAKENVNDIDMFTFSKENAREIALSLVDNDEKRLRETENAVTLKNYQYSPQFITRWVYDDPEKVIESFDFTICQAAFWFDHYCQRWASVCADDFYADLAAKRLVYTMPVRDEEPGGSILRILKYYQRGYRIVLESLAAVFARLAHGVSFDSSMFAKEQELDEKRFAKIISGLLREVDPNVDPDHIIH